MSFFDTLRHMLGKDAAKPPGNVAKAWGLNDGAEAKESAADAGVYDRAQWLKKMKRILAELPASCHEWAELVTEARALHLDPAWLTKSQVDEFMLLVRRAVSDRHFTEEEH